MAAPFETVLGRGLAFAPLRHGERPAPPAPRPWDAPPAPGHVDGAALLEIARFAEPLKRRIAALLPLRPGQRVLDVGCGPGADTMLLAPLVAPGGRIAGVDRDRAMLDAARARARAAEHGHRIGHVRADAVRLPFAPASFDVCRCERMLQHVADAGGAVGEMARVTKAGGLVVAADSDWGSLSIDVDDVETERLVVRSVAECLTNGYAGRALPRALTRAGLERIAVDVVLVHWTSFETFRRTSFMAAGLHRTIVATGRVTLERWDAFERALRAVDEAGRFFATATIIVAAGRRPG